MRSFVLATSSCGSCAAAQGEARLRDRHVISRPPTATGFPLSGAALSGLLAFWRRPAPCGIAPQLLASGPMRMSIVPGPAGADV